MKAALALNGLSNNILLILLNIQIMKVIFQVAGFVICGFHPGHSKIQHILVVSFLLYNALELVFVMNGFIDDIVVLNNGVM